MALRDEVERVLRDGRAPAGYTVRDREGGAVAVEYPDDNEVVVGAAGDLGSWRLPPSPELGECDTLLQLAGYPTGAVPGRDRHLLVVRPRRTPI